mgnify:CR=1 FL=1
MMEKKRESGEILEHMLLEEVKMESVSFIEPPEEWNPELHQKEPFVPPVLIMEKTGKGGPEESPEFTLLAHHRSFWKVSSRAQFTVRAIVVRSNVQISLAHESIKNCIEEALLFDGLLRNELCENRSRLSELLGYSRARITQILNLLKLPEEMRRKLLLTDEISEFQLRPIVRVSNDRDREEMFKHLVQGKLTGRQMALFADEKENGEGEGVEMPDMDDLMREEAPENQGEDADEIEAVSTVVGPGHVRPLMDIMKMRKGEWPAEAAKRGVSDLDIEFLKGVSMLRNGLYRQAAAVLQEVLEENPDYAPAYFYIGKCGNLTGDLEEAENALRTALELVPDEPDYLVELAIVLEKMKRDSEASTFYRKAGVIRRKSAEEGESN